MPLSVFDRLLPELSQAGLVYLQGWGEPLLHPDLSVMIRSTRASGSSVGLTTNGLLLDDRVADNLVALQTDIVALSLAGLGAGNDLRRCGVTFEQVVNAARSLARAKQKAGSSRPAVHIAFLLMRSDLAEIARMPELLEGLGVDQIVVSTLDYPAHPALDHEVIRPRDIAEYARTGEELECAAKLAESHGMQLLFHLTHPERQYSVCTENILRSMYVTAGGDVSPCVFMALGVPGPAGRNIAPLIFGNVRDSALAEIWDSEPYRAFRESFASRQFFPQCRICPKLRQQ